MRVEAFIKPKFSNFFDRFELQNSDPAIDKDTYLGTKLAKFFKWILDAENVRETAQKLANILSKAHWKIAVPILDEHEIYLQ